jgi:hypothetical protein
MLNQPTAIVAVGENDTLYVVDSGNNRLMQYEYGSNIGEQVNINTNNNGGTLNKPQDVTIDEWDGIYISDAGNNRVVKWTLDPPNIEVIMKINSPKGIYLDETTNELYAVGMHKDGYPVVMRYDFNSSKPEKVVGQKPSSNLLSSLYEPVGIHVDRNRRIYVAESGTRRITKWEARKNRGDRVIGTGNCSIALSDLCQPTSVILNATDTMYIADMSQHTILLWTEKLKTGECLLGCRRTIRENQTIEPYDINFDSKYNLLVVEKDMHRIKRFHLDYDGDCSKLFY